MENVLGDVYSWANGWKRTSRCGGGGTLGEIERFGTSKVVERLC